MSKLPPKPEGEKAIEGIAHTHRGAPVTVYLDGESRTVHPIDLPDWVEAGWSKDPDNKTKKKP